MAVGLSPPPPKGAVAFVTTHQPPADINPSADQVLVSALATSIHTFLQPPASLRSASLILAKRYLDPLAHSTSDLQVTRQRDARRKRRRGQNGNAEENVLRLKQIHLEGFGIDQIWEQARRVLDASRYELERSLPDILSQQDPEKVVAPANPDDSKYAKSVHFEDKDFDPGFESETRSISNSDVDIELHVADYDNEEFDTNPDRDLGLSHNATENDKLEQKETHEDDVEDIFDDSELGSESEGLEQSNELIQDKHGLNDGFFSIDEFNRNTDFLERQDAKGDPDDGAASDEEDIDWEVDPMTRALPIDDKKSTKTEGVDEESSEEDDGPTFGNADLNAQFDSSDDDGEEEADQTMVDDDGLSNTNDILYKDFFAPPPQALSKTKQRRALPKTQPSTAELTTPTQEDIQRTIASVRRDIFSDDDISNASGDEGIPSASKNLSTHERRQRTLASQIRTLESEAVAHRAWTMSGEARAVDRPLNSLLEEHLDFETTGKPIPVITAEVSASIEELIKARILARSFDEVIARRLGTDALNTLQPSTRRGLVPEELDDRKNEQSLAELYETEHLRKTDPNYVDKRDAKLKAAHAQIESLWADVSSKLDALSNWHYRPKPPGVEVSVVTDAPRVRMEDARPSGVGVGAEESGLAPQEIYKVGGATADAKKDGDEARVVVTKAGGISSKEELTREQKFRRRRRDKERTRKNGNKGLKPSAASGPGLTNDARKNAAAKGQERQREKKAILGDLKRAGVRVIGKRGELLDIEGKKAAIGITGRGKGAGSFKL